MQTPTRNINILDLVLTNACDMVSSVHVVDGIIGSDHNAVADLEIQKGGFRYACSRWSTKQEHKHTIFSTRAIIDINGLTLTDFLGQECN